MATTLEEKDAIRDLMSEYCFYVDNGEFEKFAELFTVDGIFETGKLGRLQGRRAIQEFIAAHVPRAGEGPARKHCTMNHLIRVNGREANAQSYIVLVRESKEYGVVASLAGRYEDQLVKENGRWRFKVRKIHMDISGDLGLKKELAFE
ncbi:MAG TPA: nuclear transport factor 2 family protein [Candidatus Binataceae bacterium]|jgi:uncharacterized protein (TIGR02246 family)|nr:nuclear transport factor 2 family protein [Candidatus Binataceae bacterium]